MKLFEFFKVAASAVLDFLYGPIIRSHMREVALRAPVLPGQIWNLPGLGEVRVVAVNDAYVGYTIYSDPDSDEYTCPRKDFVIHSLKRERKVPQDTNFGKVIPFNKKDKEPE